MSVPFTNGSRLDYFHLDPRDTGGGGGDESFHTWEPLVRRRRKKQTYNSLQCGGVVQILKKEQQEEGETNHQFHTEPTTVPNVGPIAIQALLIPFGAFGALKGLIVPSSALR